MEGTRHEKAALISVAYFIGALTAFIWYGASQTGVLSVIEPVGTQSASVVSAVKEPKNEEVSGKRNGIALYHDGVLDVESIDGVKVLSFSTETSGFAGSPEFEVQGMHVGDLIFSVSPSEEYVFFCEQKTLALGVCSPFIYDVLGDTIYAVSSGVTEVEVTLNTAKSATWGASGLELGGIVSASNKAPWVMTTN